MNFDKTLENTQHRLSTKTQLAIEAFCEVHNQFFGSLPTIIGTFVDANTLLVTSAPNIEVEPVCHLEVNSTQLGQYKTTLTPFDVNMRIYHFSSENRKLTFHVPENFLLSDLYHIMQNFTKFPIRPVHPYTRSDYCDTYSDFESYAPNLPGGMLSVREEKRRKREISQTKRKRDDDIVISKKSLSDPRVREAVRNQDGIKAEKARNNNRSENIKRPEIVINNNFADPKPAPAPPALLAIENGLDYELPDEILVLYFKSNFRIWVDYLRSLFAGTISVFCVYAAIKSIWNCPREPPSPKAAMIAFAVLIAYERLLKVSLTKLLKPSAPDMKVIFKKTGETMAPQKRHFRNRQQQQVPTILTKYSYSIVDVGLQTTLDAVMEFSNKYRFGNSAPADTLTTKLVGKLALGCAALEPVLSYVSRSNLYKLAQTPSSISDQFFEFGDLEKPKSFWVSQELVQKLLTPKHISGNGNLDLTLNSINQAVNNSSDSAISTEHIETNAAMGSSILAKHVAISAFHRVNALGFESALLKEYLNSVIELQSSLGPGGRQYRPNPSEILRLNYWISASAYTLVDQCRRASEYIALVSHYLILIFLTLWVLYLAKSSVRAIEHLFSLVAPPLLATVQFITIQWTNLMNSATARFELMIEKSEACVHPL